MNIKILVTGSIGNCYEITASNTNILIEAGVAIQKIKKGLDYKLSDIDGCIISHQHRDHCKAVPEILEFGIPCYMLQDVKDSLRLKNNHNLNIFDFGEQFKIGSFTILPFELEHDVPNAGFLIATGNGKLVYLTDTYFCKYIFPRLTHIMLEVNYSADILDENIKQGSVYASTKERLLSNHFSLKNTKDFLLANDLSKCEEIHLIHLSKRNSDSEMFQSEIEKLTGVPVYREIKEQRKRIICGVSGGLMTKLIEIHNCYRCSHCGTLDCRSHFCRKSNRRKITTNIFAEIPDWCVLEDEEINDYGKTREHLFKIVL